MRASDFGSRNVADIKFRELFVLIKQLHFREAGLSGEPGHIACDSEFNFFTQVALNLSLFDKSQWDNERTQKISRRASHHHFYFWGSHYPTSYACDRCKSYAEAVYFCDIENCDSTTDLLEFWFADCAGVYHHHTVSLIGRSFAMQ